MHQIEAVATPVLLRHVDDRQRSVLTIGGRASGATPVLESPARVHADPLVGPHRAWVGAAVGHERVCTLDQRRQHPRPDPSTLQCVEHEQVAHQPNATRVDSATEGHHVVADRGDDEPTVGLDEAQVPLVDAGVGLGEAVRTSDDGDAGEVGNAGCPDDDLDLLLPRFHPGIVPERDESALVT